MGATDGIYTFSLPTRLVIGADSVERLGSLVREQGADRVFLITDQGLVAAGHVARAEKILTDQGIEVQVFDQVPQNPDADDVEACRQALGDRPVDLLIGFGGGSSIDVAKGCNFLRAGGGKMEDYWGVGKAKGELLPLIAVPTTAGTGTEVQSFALIEQPGTHQKMACGDRRAAPVVAILDPTLTMTMPGEVTAHTGLDTIGHAVEAAVTRKRNGASRLYAHAALRLVEQHFETVLRNPKDLPSREGMLKAAAFAGIAIEHSMLGAAHSMANPLTAHFAVTHGQAVGMALAHVVRFNAADPATAETYADLARGAGIAPPDHDTSAAVDALVGRLFAWLTAAGVDWSLRSAGVTADRIERLAEEASRQWTAQFNPRDVGPAEFRALFEQASA